MCKCFVSSDIVRHTHFKKYSIQFKKNYTLLYRKDIPEVLGLTCLGIDSRVLGVYTHVCGAGEN